MVLELDIQIHKKGSRHKPHNYHIKVLEGDKEENLGDLWLGDDVLHTTSKTGFIKETIGKVDFFFFFFFFLVALDLS